MRSRQAIQTAWLLVGQIILLGMIIATQMTAAEDLIWFGYLAPIVQLIVVYCGSSLGPTLGRKTFPKN